MVKGSFIFLKQIVLIAFRFKNRLQDLVLIITVYKNTKQIAFRFEK